MKRTTQLPIAIRAYTEKPDTKPVASKTHSKGPEQPSNYMLIFDCETTTDAAQKLRFGVYQIRKSNVLQEEGLFLDATALNDTEIQILKRYAQKRKLSLITLDTFREKLLEYAYDLRALIVGFNLPFDLSRIALSQSEARGSMRGGFSFALSEDKERPRVRVKHLSKRAALIDLAVPGNQDTPRSKRKRGEKTPPRRGYFIDIKTLAAALTSRSHSLHSLCEHLGTATRKTSSDDHGLELSEDYLDYARTDVQATWECYQELSSKYAQHSLETPAHRILSEASVGKAYLKAMGIQPLLACQPDFPREVFGKVMCGYYGGRAEVRIRREITRVLYCDFKSMYPTVNTLMGLWRFVIAQDMQYAGTTDATRKFLHSVTLADLQDKEAWQQLTTFVRVRSDRDLFPVRAKYDGKSDTIGLNYLSCDDSLWFTLADCVAAKLLSGKTPVIEEAITFIPGNPQDDLQPIDLFGNAQYCVDPLQDDVFKRFVDLRDEAKARKDDVQKSIKIIANATSYGIFIEIMRDDAPKAEAVNVFGPDTGKISTTAKAIEEPGRYFNPIIGTLITGAARLMLACAEHRVLDAGLDWVFCDTDSIAIAKPAGMHETEFIERAQGVVDWFKALNPYEKTGSILQIEDINHAIDNPGQIVPLHAFAISAKRYALFNLDANGQPVIRKASAHGLGHLMPPYTEDNAPTDIPAPAMRLAEIGVDRWQYDLWFKIIEAALNDHPERVSLDYHPALQNPAPSRYGATSPRLRKWFDAHNEGLDYADQVKPFNFLLSFQGKNGIWAEHSTSEAEHMPGRGRPKKAGKISPVASFNRDPMEAASQAFDRATGEPVSIDQLQTYAECLARYHLSPEAKFDNGDYWDRGKTQRRHVVASDVRLIGKEGNRVEEDGLNTPSSQLELKDISQDREIG